MLSLRERMSKLQRLCRNIQNSMKFLGIDYGLKKIGIAKSDSDGQMAFPMKNIANNEHVYKEIKDIIEVENIEHIVIGKSLNYKREENPIMEQAYTFAKELTEKTGLDISFFDETLTTAEALRAQEKGSKLDASAAALMLNSYLNAHGNS